RRSRPSCVVPQDPSSSSSEMSSLDFDALQHLISNSDEEVPEESESVSTAGDNEQSEQGLASSGTRNRRSKNKNRMQREGCPEPFPIKVRFDGESCEATSDTHKHFTYGVAFNPFIRRKPNGFEVFATCGDDQI